MTAARLLGPAFTWPRLRLAVVASLAALSLAACATTSPPRIGASQTAASGGGLHGTDKPYQIDGKWYYPHPQPGYDEVGSASWYGREFHNRHTADGEIFDQFRPSAAHKTLPLPCLVEVTNLENGHKLTLRVNDRGPFVGDRILDVSRAAAEALGFRRQGLTRVRVRYVGPAPPLAPFTYARADHPASPAQDDPDDGSAPAPPVQSTPITAAPVIMASLPPRRPLMPTDSPTAGGFAIQAAAFSNPDNARRAADQLAAAGAASIVPMINHQGVTLYRVVLAGFPDAGAAEAARAQVVAAGFRDARVITAF